MGPLLASKRLRPGEVLNCFLPRRQAAIGGVPPAISGACGRAAGADAALLELHYTPTHGSWLDVAEIELAVLAEQGLDRRLAGR